MTQLQFFNPYAEVRHTENRLPHWQQNGAVYFVTFRLADAVPFKLISDWHDEREVWLDLNPKPWNQATEFEYHKRFSGKMEQWLDAGYGSCILRQRDCGAIVDEAVRHFDGERMGLISSIVMPNHVHVLFVQHPEYPLEKLLRSWKSYTTRQLNSLLERSGSLWQSDYFDRLVRDQQHFENCVRYIRRNPQKANLRSDEFILYENPVARQVD